jgi:hypothetical protein
MARPRLSKKVSRSAFVGVRVTPQVERALARAAEKAGLPLSDYLRDVFLRATDPDAMRSGMERVAIDAVARLQDTGKLLHRVVALMDEMHVETKELRAELFKQSAVNRKILAALPVPSADVKQEPICDERPATTEANSVRRR